MLSKSNKPLVLASCLVAVALIVISFLFVPFVVLVCWNIVFPQYTITFVQAVAGWVLVLIAGSAFKGVTGSFHKS